MRRFFSRLLVAMLSIALALPGWTQTAEPTYSKEQLDQLLAPIALYPDSLLSQVLMASTYPADVAEAVKWSAAHPNDMGDAAVTKVQNEPWEASVQSLVAFPQVLATMGQKPEWVQDLGDAFLAQPTDVMDAVQRLRQLAQAAGQLKSNEQQKVVVQQPQPSQPSIIVIEPAQPQVVYVPMYNPTVVYGPWPYPAYPPYYMPPPPGYYVGNALLTGMAFGVGLAITNSLWGGANWGWGNSSVNVNVNRYNNINVNKINVNQTNFNHNAAARKGVPYRDAGVNQKYGKSVGGKDARNDYRGRDGNDAKRDAARDTLAQRTNDPKTREKLEQQGANRPGANGAQDRSANRPDKGGAAERAPTNRDRPDGSGRATQQGAKRPDNALSGAGNGAAAKPQIERGQASREAAAKPASRPQPAKPAATPAAKPAAKPPAKPAAKPASRPTAPTARPASKPAGGGAAAARGGARGQ
jgi:hypothetical protein